jgi:hypothetical protein
MCPLAASRTATVQEADVILGSYKQAAQEARDSQQVNVGPRSEAANACARRASLAQRGRSSSHQPPLGAARRVTAASAHRLQLATLPSANFAPRVQPAGLHRRLLARTLSSNPPPLLLPTGLATGTTGCGAAVCLAHGPAIDQMRHASLSAAAWASPQTSARIAQASVAALAWGGSGL